MNDSNARVGGTRAQRFAIHQPNYLPWLGYFYKMAVVDIFVLLDNVQYPRGGSFANRNRIKTPNGTQFLTVPVSVPAGRKGKAGYDEIVFADEKWRTKHLRALEVNYKKAPYFDEVYRPLAAAIESAPDLLHLNLALIEWCAEYLELTCRLIRLSDLAGTFGQKSDLIVDIAEAIGADEYLSGTGGGRDYNDAAVLDAAGVSLRYSEFVHPTYPQLWGDFESHLAVVDLLMNCGPESHDVMLSGTSDEP